MFIEIFLTMMTLAMLPAAVSKLPRAEFKPQVELARLPGSLATLAVAP